METLKNLLDYLLYFGVTLGDLAWVLVYILSMFDTVLEGLSSAEIGEWTFIGTFRCL